MANGTNNQHETQSGAGGREAIETQDSANTS
jgi:hypothetical protein